MCCADIVPQLLYVEGYAQCMTAAAASYASRYLFDVEGAMRIMAAESAGRPEQRLHAPLLNLTGYAGPAPIPAPFNHRLPTTCTLLAVMTCAVCRLCTAAAAARFLPRASGRTQYV